jgi:uncharacterized protein
MKKRPRRETTEAELNALEAVCDRLDAFDAPHGSVPWLDGFFTALACGPVRIPIEQCLEDLFDDAFDRAFGDPVERTAALKAINDRLAVVHDQLDAQALLDDPEALRLNPVFDDWDEADRRSAAEKVAQGDLLNAAANAVNAQGGGPVGLSGGAAMVQAMQALQSKPQQPSASDADEPSALEVGSESLGEEGMVFDTGVVWAEGVLHGLTQLEPLWGLQMDDDLNEAMEELTEPVIALMLVPTGPRMKAYLASHESHDGAELPELPERDQLLADACYALQDLRVLLLDHGPRPETRRVEATPGRNDPCHCGSGKKFKKCHGLDA